MSYHLRIMPDETYLEPRSTEPRWDGSGEQLELPLTPSRGRI